MPATPLVVLLRHLLLYASLCWLGAGAQALAQDGGWKVESEKRGITVSSRPQRGARLPAFRGEGVIDGNVLQLLAVILDVREIERWAYGITSARKVADQQPAGDLVHLYSDTPWPLSDRDMVVRRSFKVLSPGRKFSISIRCQPDAAPEKSGVVRVRACDSRFVLERVDENHSRVIYESSLEPAGSVPRWASTWIAENAPFRTLVALEGRAKRTAGRYAAVRRRWQSVL